MQEGKLAIWEGLTNSWEKNRSERQRLKGKIHPIEYRALVISLGNGLLGQRKLFQHWEVLYDSHLAAWATHRAAALRMCSEGNAECYEWAQLWSLLAARQTKPWPLLPQGSFNTSLQSTSAFPKLWSSSPLTGTLLSLFPWIYAMKAKVEAGFICWVPVNVGSWSHNTRAC